MIRVRRKMRIEIVMLVLSYASTGSAIECYQCNSTDLKNPYQCSEFMENSNLEPLPCNAVYGAAFCIKQTGRFEGGLGTKRFCSSLDLGNYCNFIQQPGDPFEYRSCVYTCYSDGCNGSNSIFVNSFNTIFLLVLLSILNTLQKV